MTKEEAREIFNTSVKVYKNLLEMARIERDTRKDEYDEARKQCKKAYQEYKEVAIEAREIYLQNIGEEI